MTGRSDPVRASYHGIERPVDGPEGLDPDHQVTDGAGRAGDSGEGEGWPVEAQLPRRSKPSPAP